MARIHTKAQFVGGGHVHSPRDCRDDTEHRGNPNCAGADDLTGNSRGSGKWQESTPKPSLSVEDTFTVHAIAETTQNIVAIPTVQELMI